MTLFFTLLTFIAITGIAIFMSMKFKISSSLTPFISICFEMMFLSVFGCLGIIRIGGYIYYILAIAAIIYSIKNYKQVLDKIKEPGFIFFLGASLFVIILFSIKQPMFMLWDEFSFWGTSIKLVKIYDQLYTTAPIGWAWFATQKPGFIMNGYMFEFFGKYQEWRACAGMDVLIFSSIATLGAVFKNKEWHKSVPFISIGFLTPFAFSLYNTIYGQSSIYMSVMADVPMGMIFGGVLCLYFASKNKPNTLWAVCISLMALTFTKDTALPLAMVAAGIICVDILINENKIEIFKLNGFKAKIINCVFVFLAPLVSFFAWTKYLGTVLSIDVTGNVGGSDEMGMVQMLITGIKQLFGFMEPTEKFSQVMGKMYSSYFEMNLTVLGSGFKVTIITLALILIAIIISKDLRYKIRCAVFGVLSSIGFLMYYIFIGFCFVFVFKEAESSTLMSYERYIYPYYIGWFLAALMLLAIAMVSKKRRLYGLGRIPVFAIMLVMILRLSNIVLPGYSFIDFQEGFLDDRKVQEQKAQSIAEYVGDSKDNIFFIGQGDDGDKWFKYSSQLLPLQLEYSFGGGTLCLPDAQIEDDSPYYIKMTPEELLEYLDEKECEYIFVELSDDFLKDGFGYLFSDNLENCKDGQSALYRVVNDKFEFIGEVK